MPDEESEKIEDQSEPRTIWTCSDRGCGVTNAAVSATCYGCGRPK